MADSKKWITIWGNFVAGDKVDRFVFIEAGSKIIKMIVGSVQAGKCPAGHAPVIYEYEDNHNNQRNPVNYVPIDDLSRSYKN